MNCRKPASIVIARPKTLTRGMQTRLLAPLLTLAFMTPLLSVAATVESISATHFRGPFPPFLVFYDYTRLRSTGTPVYLDNRADPQVFRTAYSYWPFTPPGQTTGAQIDCNWNILSDVDGDGNLDIVATIDEFTGELTDSAGIVRATISQHADILYPGSC